MKKPIDITTFSDTSADFVDETTGDYHFTIDDVRYKVRRMTYKVQRRLVNQITELGGLGVRGVEDFQDQFYALVWVRVGDNAWEQLTENNLEKHLSRSEYKPIDFLNVLFKTILDRLLENFIDTEEVSPPVSLSQKQEGGTTKGDIPRKILSN